MADEAHLDNLVAQQTDPMARSLLEEFARIIRDPNISAADYPVRLRQVMDRLFKELIDAPAQSDST